MALKRKIIITGHAEHGKDTVCEYLRDKFGITFESSSFTACELFIFDELKDKFGYKTIEECYADRRQHRKLWGDMITEFNNENGLDALGKIILGRSDCYNGIRKILELNALKDNGIVDFVIWVDASDRMPPESIESMNIPITAADMVISNNGTKEELYPLLDNLGEMLLSLK